MAKAQAEFTSGVMQNETVRDTIGRTWGYCNLCTVPLIPSNDFFQVRQAAAEAAQAQVRSAFGGNQQQQQGGRF